ncbi:MAG: TRAM domain-containing protein [Nitrososphaerota archaeon]|jgi:predicted RNA-binding protein with TRAM domain|nr:TRAM domain-containing protein [Nitrososphaerota archaeon]MDG6966291.1 TRAM domain-containing protein [Nitrososphaerota archaeon]MDG6977726.1 TRAM domain-containing protein [Nitrososphaerota archaeon]MDG7005331.1 TRAM domain-containing protein [Nitrososphaerota archaeon]MDG7021054.1 TRAM domain-containing protein [Nitrososphaerota archaeon]
MSYGNRSGGRGGYGGSRGGGYGGSGGFGSSFKPKPVEVGKEYDVSISDTSRRGEGIAKIDGFVIFVAGAKQGQSARIKITRVTDRFATGDVVTGAGSGSSESTTDSGSSDEQGA